jgi:hypothetical protein
MLYVKCVTIYGSLYTHLHVHEIKSPLIICFIAFHLSRPVLRFGGAPLGCPQAVLCFLGGTEESGSFVPDLGF